MVTIPISTYFNNKGLSNIKNIDSASLSPVGSSIPVLTTEEGLFRLDGNQQKDNVECMGQSIYFSKLIKIKKLKFIGVGVYADVQDYLNFRDVENKIYKVEIKFSEYDNSIPFFKENRQYFKSEYLHSKNTNNKKIENKKGVIWEYNTTLDDLILLKNIELPFHPGMHIFGIIANEGECYE